VQDNERRGSRRLEYRWSEIGDILEGGDIPILRRLEDLGSIVSSPIVIWPPSANASAFWHILGATGRIQHLKGRGVWVMKVFLWVQGLKLFVNIT